MAYYEGLVEIVGFHRGMWGLYTVYCRGLIKIVGFIRVV